ARLVEAFGYIAGHRGRDLQLVLAGGKGWLYEPLLRRVQELGLADRVIFTGYVPDEDVAPLLSGAVCFAFPSLYEGFGFPVLEAMACGTPVVCANSASLPEVAGDAAWLVDPLDVEAIAEGLDRVLNDDALRAELIERGFANVRRFSWQRCARETMEVLGS
ncbi:MAG TPA: glycosyltransferase family 1 protein, partial [Anaerolineae bacterium]|nr:glycosyltransferase family 1 protein [Anaerolineae bacterium]